MGLHLNERMSLKSWTELAGEIESSNCSRNEDEFPVDFSSNSFEFKHLAKSVQSRVNF